MRKFLAIALILFSSTSGAQKLFVETNLYSKPANLVAIPADDRLFISYKFFDQAANKKTKMLWIDSTGVIHNMPDNDLLSKPFIAIVKHEESDYFYFIERDNQDNYLYLRALVINNKTNNYQIPKTKILIDGHPAGCDNEGGLLQLYSFNHGTKEFTRISVAQLEVIQSKKFLLPVDQLNDPVMINSSTAINLDVGRFRTKIFPQSNKTIIVIDSDSTNNIVGSMLNTIVLSLDQKTETVSRLNIEENALGRCSSFAYGNTLFRAYINDTKAIIRSYDINSKTELATFNIYPETSDANIWKRDYDEITNQNPVNSLLHYGPDIYTTLFVTPVDSSNLRICLGSYKFTPANYSYNYHHVNQSSGDIGYDLLYLFVIEPAINAAAYAIEASIVNAKDRKSGPKGNCYYLYLNYDKQTSTFSYLSPVSNASKKTSAELMDEFDLIKKSEQHLKSLGSVTFNDHEYGIFFKRKKNALVLMELK